MVNWSYVKNHSYVHHKNANVDILIGDTPSCWFQKSVKLSLDIMKGIRETSFISNSESPEYKLIVRLTPEVRTAIQGDLQNISDHLLSFGMITQDNHEDFTNDYKSTHSRAASLIRAVQNKVKLDCHNFWKFTKVLEKNKQYYSSILQKLYSHNMDSPPMYSQHRVCEESSSESDETGALLHVRVPYVQYEDDSQCRKPERQYSLSNAVYVFCSSFIDKVDNVCFMEFAAGRPLKSILVLFVIGALLLIMIGIVAANVTSVYDYHNVILVVIILFIALICDFQYIVCCCCRIIILFYDD